VAAPTQYRPGRVLLVLLVFVIALVSWAFRPGQTHVPRLGLDLQGGTQVILAPQPIEAGQEITEEILQETVGIVRQRVNGIGVAEADIAVQGSGSNAVIVVSVPGVTQDRIVDLVGQTALLNFRPVQQILAPEPTDPAGQPLTTPAPPATDEQGQPVEGAQIVQAPQPDEAFTAAALALDCTKPENQSGGTPDDPTQYLATCDRSGAAKYILEPAFIRGTNINTAAAQLPQQGAGGWLVTLDFDSEGAGQLAEVSQRLSALQPPQNQFAIVLDGVVFSAPSFREPILGGSAQITGTFTAQQAQDLAQVLKFGALPVKLEVQAVESVSPTLGSDQLRAGIIAGLLGLALVALYLIAYYRMLGVIAVLSLMLAALITYASFVVMGRSIGFTLTLAGIAGAIVSIGITADSFIVYFERLRDEIRDGKSLRQAADAGWLRARRTLLAADFVSILAAVVLYWLSVGNVRGFAFALGLTTVVDVIVAFLFTRPLVAILCRSKWMNRGGPLTGVSPARLGVTSLEGRRREKGTARTGSKQEAQAAMAGARDGEA
jgi:preprotein translocase subunit SecD